MGKAVKRVCKTKINNCPKSKSVKLIDFTNLTKDISILQTFYDFIDNTDYDVIEDYLSKHDLNDFLNFFSNHHLYKLNDFSLIFKVCTEILMRIVGDETKNHTLSGQAFAEAFINNHKPRIYEYLKSVESNSRIISCLKFLTALILQSKDIAIKIAININFLLSNYSKLLTIRKLIKDEDVHTCLLNCYASFFVMNSNYLIMKACEENALVGSILKDLRFDRFNNVQLMIEILHDKIIKNGSVSKTTKLKIFCPSNLRFLFAVYEWKGEAVSYNEFLKLSSVDENCGTIHNQLHEMLLELCSNHQTGIVFVDNLLCQSSLGNQNRKLYYFITPKDSFQQFFSHKKKHELLIAILKACPDLVNPFVEYLVGLMIVRKSEYWSDLFKCIVESYGLLNCVKINNILTEAWNYDKGKKFIDIAMIICAPSKSLMEFLHTNENIRVICEDNIRELRNKLIDICEKVLTWINITDVFRSQQQKSVVKLNFEQILLEIFTKCGWDYELKILLSEDLNDEKMFIKSEENEEIETEDELEELFDPEISEHAIRLKQFNEGISNPDINGNELLKKCYHQFISSSFNNIFLLKLIGETLKIGQLSLKKKSKHCLIEKLTTNEFFSDHWALMLPQDEYYKISELKRNCILDIIITCLENSKSLKAVFYERIHPLKLLSVYGASLSTSDQKILFLIILQCNSGIICSDYNFLLFGNPVNEHYLIEYVKSPVLKRPILNSQCFNLIEDEKLKATINHFPISRTYPIELDNKLNVMSSQCNIYDPFFILEWISQFINIKSDSKLELDYGIDMKTLFSKQIISFLIACQTSYCRHMRLVSKLHLKHFLEILDSSNVIVDFPIKTQLEMILFHFLHTLSDHEDHIQLSSIFTNFYIRVLHNMNNPGKTLYSLLMDIFILNPKFDLRYVPNFLKLMYSPDIDARLLQKWCLNLLSDSIKTVEDFRILLNTKALTHILSLYDNSDQNNKRHILNLLKNSVMIPKVAMMLHSFPQFVMWLNFRANFKKEKINHYLFLEIIQSFINSLKNYDKSKINIEELESVLRSSEIFI